MSQDPLVLLQRRWNTLVSAIQELAETMPPVVQEIAKLREENADLKKLLEDKKAQEVKT